MDLENQKQNFWLGKHFWTWTLKKKGVDFDLENLKNLDRIFDFKIVFLLKLWT